jgi:hypothetical protein
VERPDREATHLGGNDIIRVGQTVWSKPPNGPWQVIGNNGPGKLAAFMQMGLPPNPVVAGPPTLGNDGTGPAHVYVVSGSGPDPALRWFVRIADGRIHHVESTTPTDMTVDIDRYGEPLDIEPPM